MNILSQIAFLSAALGLVSCIPLLTSEFIEGEGLMYEGVDGTASEYAPVASDSAASYGTNYGTGYGTDYSTASYNSVYTLYDSNSAPGVWTPPPPAPELRHPHPRHAHPHHARPHHPHPRHDNPPHHAHHPSPRGIHPPKDLKDSKGDGFRTHDRHFRKGDPKPQQGKAKTGNPPQAPKAPGKEEKPAKEHKNH